MPEREEGVGEVVEVEICLADHFNNFDQQIDIVNEDCEVDVVAKDYEIMTKKVLLLMHLTVLRSIKLFFNLFDILVSFFMTLTTSVLYPPENFLES